MRLLLARILSRFFFRLMKPDHARPISAFLIASAPDTISDELDPGPFSCVYARCLHSEKRVEVPNKERHFTPACLHCRCYPRHGNKAPTQQSRFCTQVPLVPLSPPRRLYVAEASTLLVSFGNSV